MLIIMLLIVISLIFLLIAHVCIQKDALFLGGISICFLISSVVFTVYLFGCFCVYHSKYFSGKKIIELEQKRNAIEYALLNESSIIELSSYVAEYNNEVLSGRYDLQNKWFHDLTYQFWNDIPLIEL